MAEVDALAHGLAASIVPQVIQYWESLAGGSAAKEPVAYTATKTGNWSDISTWDPAGVPENTDTVTIPSGYTVTVDEDAIIGASADDGGSTLAITMTGGANLVIAAGKTLVVRGDMQGTGANGGVTMQAGSVFEWDSSQHATDPTNQHYRCYGGTNHSEKWSWTCSGTSGSRCTIRSHASGGNGYFFSDRFKAMLPFCEYADFLRIGTSATPMWNGGYSAGTAYGCNFTNCRFDACGAYKNIYQLHAADDLIFDSCHWENTVATECIYLQAASAPTTGIRVITGCSFDKRVLLYACTGITITHNILSGYVTTVGPVAEFANNCVIDTGTDPLLMLGTISDSLFVKHNDAGNPHFIQAVSSQSQTLERLFFAYTGSYKIDAGDCVSVSNASTVTVANCVVMAPEQVGSGAGTILSALGNADASFSVDHCTCVGDAWCAWGETYAGYAGMCTSFKSNLFNGGPSYVVQYQGTNDYCDAADCDYNGGDYSGTKYNGVTMTGSPGANDVSDEDPALVLAATLADVDTQLGGPGTAANLIAELLNMHGDGWDTAYTAQDVIDYLKACYRPTNATYQDAGHDGETVGAYDYVAP